jgi:hypothetical protein
MILTCCYCEDSSTFECGMLLYWHLVAQHPKSDTVTQWRKEVNEAAHLASVQARDKIVARIESSKGDV